jgi:Cytochrome P460
VLRGGVVYADPPEPPRGPKGAHANALPSFGVVYANDAARGALQSDGRARFPVGSIIVREKLWKPDDAQPSLLSVMVKRAAGFNRKAGDWEFLVIDGEMTKVRERQKGGSGLECHASQRDRDFVYPLSASK